MFKLLTLADIYNNEFIKASIGGTYDDLDSLKVDPGYLLKVQHVSVENKTSAYTRLTIGVAVGETYHEHEEEDSPAAANIYWTRSKLYVPAGHVLRARLTGCTAADVLHLNVQGKLYKVGC